MKLYTIGHSNHTIEKFIQLLEESGIAALVDVRSAPYSRYNPQFNKEALAETLNERWIEYIYAGNHLGGRPKDPSCYKGRKITGEEVDYLHEVDYPEVMKKNWFIQGIERLLEIADERTAAIVCSEENPAECHRHHLIAKFIHENHPEVVVYHIRGDGNVFKASSLLSSLDEQSAEQLSLF